MKQLNEYNDYPRWVDTLTKEQQYEWYLIAKEYLAQRDLQDKNIARLANVVAEYETKNNIK